LAQATAFRMPFATPALGCAMTVHAVSSQRSTNPTPVVVSPTAKHCATDAQATALRSPVPGAESLDHAEPFHPSISGRPLPKPTGMQADALKQVTPASAA